MPDDLEREVRPALEAAARDVARYARIFNRQAHGAWLASEKGEPIVVDGARVVNLDHAGHLIEWGSRNNPPHAPLRRAAMAAGLRLKEDPRGS